MKKIFENEINISSEKYPNCAKCRWFQKMWYLCMACGGKYAYDVYNNNDCKVIYEEIENDNNK